MKEFTFVLLLSCTILLTQADRVKRQGGGGGGGGGGGSPGKPGLPGGKPGLPGGNPLPSVKPVEFSEASLLDGVSKAGKVCAPVLEMKVPLEDKDNWLTFLLKLAEAGQMDCAKILIKEFGIDEDSFGPKRLRRLALISK